MKLFQVASCAAMLLAPAVAQQFAQTCPMTEPACALNGTLDNCCVNRDGWIVLSQQWIPSFQPMDKFTVHGLWPDHCDGTFVTDTCDSTRNYQNVGDIVLQKDPALYKQMLRYWPSTSANSAFWQHEWYKHGTCYNVANPPCLLDYTLYDDMILYFQIVMREAKRYDLYQALKNEGIVPGATYTKAQFVDALYNQLGLYVVPRCTSKGVLTEIWSYFSLYGQDTFVPRVNDYNPNDCANIVYPAKTVSPPCQA
ncbi:Ribonuclease Rh [Smittium mucronatum]|uniref:ribonuclease T2 n=1 Tax=Smittium mucronatum TaxID=133383 RepID=A0A1R0GVE8_9FUNG|nr:Ribonuclease Rh [Smittium mucronatum]OLY80818.1 Ribonuclease Rh [Smittium mucronatum]